MADAKDQASRPAASPRRGGKPSPRKPDETEAASAPASAPPSSPSLGFYAAGTVLMLPALWLLGAVLDVPGGWGVEDFLGWTDTGEDGPVELLLRLWDQSGRTPAAWLYLGLDSVLLVPLYTGLLLGLAVRLARALGADKAERRAQRERVALGVLVPPALALVLVDLLENALGLARVGWLGPWLALGCTALAAAALQAGGTLRQLGPRLGRQEAWVTLGLAAALLLLLGFGSPACTPPGQPRGPWPAQLACGAHAGKTWLMGLVLLLQSATALAWLLGVSLPANAPPALRTQRAQLRAAVVDVLLRSRYVLLALAALAVLLLGSGAARDALYATAVSPFRASHAGLAERLLRALGMVAGFALTGLALWLLVHACWLWTRAACQLRREHSPEPAAPAAAPPGQAVARLWARMLGLAPAVLMAAAAAATVRETVRLQALGATALWPVPVMLLVIFGLCALALGGGFLLRRHLEAEVQCYDALTWPALALRAGVVAPALSAGADPASASAPARGANPNLRKSPGLSPASARAGVASPSASPTRAAAPPAAGAGAAALPAPKYRFWNVLPPQALPPLLLALLLACRAVDLLPGPAHAGPLDLLPTLGLAAALLTVALWLCLLGGLSLFELATARPWAGALLLAVLGLAVAGWTGNAAVWPAVDPEDAAAAAGGLRMLAFTALLGGVLLLAHALALREARERALARADTPRQPLGATAALAVPGLWALALLVLWIADHGASARTPAVAEAVAPADRRPTLDAALAAWLRSLCGQAGAAAPAIASADPIDAPACTPPLALDERGALRVYLVAGDGPGMRGAAWMALALQQLNQHDAQWLRRTFAITGAGGASVGAALTRACTVDGHIAEDCVRGFVRADLQSPLLSAGLFEDALAWLLPTHWCALPGCAVLSRAAWFEQALESASPGLRLGLMESRRLALAFPGDHLPYLLLQAQWLETGERAIASDLRIAWTDFPGTHDQLGITGRDMPLGTAAHNAARAAPLHPPGALQGGRERCRDRSVSPADEAASDAHPARKVRRPVCGHLADGSHADPGGAQATLDLLQALSRCLFADAGDRLGWPRCAALGEARLAWLRARLLPQLLLVRGAEPASAPVDGQCPSPDQRAPGTLQLAMAQPVAGCAAPVGGAHEPRRPMCQAPAPLAGLAWLQAQWSPQAEAAAALAESRQAQAIAALRAAMGGVARDSTQPAVRTLALRPDGLRYGAGWHLSALSVERMQRQAVGCVGAVGP